jgi:transposase
MPPEDPMSDSSPANPAPRLRQPERKELALHAMALDELLTPDHTARLAWDFASRLDLSSLYADIKAVEGHPGNTPIDPRLLFALWLYATIDGVNSARELERLCEEHAAYRWLCGGVSVNYHTLSDFRVAHGDLLDDQLTRSIAVLLDQEMITLNVVAQDGVRVRASAGADTFRRKPTLTEHLAKAREHLAALQAQEGESATAATARQRARRDRAAHERVERLEAALAQMPALEASREAYKKGTADQARCSPTDPDARNMKMADGGFRPAFNFQFTTDTKSGLVVDATVVNKGVDNGQMGESLERIEQRYGQAAAQTLVDSGFASHTDIETAAANGTEVYMPIKNEAKKLAAGENPYQPLPEDSPAVAAWRARMGTADGQALYRLRASTAEWVNAGCRNRGLYQVRVRGLEKVRCCALWQALAHNVLRATALGYDP